MKLFTSIALGVATAGTLVAAQPHQHRHHRHVVKRDSNVNVVEVPGPTVTAWYLDGTPVSEAEVAKGLKAGYFTYSEPPPAPVVKPTPPPASSSTPPPPPPPPSTTQAKSPAVFAAPSSSPAPVPSKSSGGGGTAGGKGLDTPFPDGTVDCSNFPDEYGPIALNYLGHSGWIGIQSGGNSNIKTGISGDGCTEGAYCSYACPPGYQKSQWPTTQGASGESIGGILCKGGKLFKTNTNWDTLCIRGTGGITIVNKMNTNAAVCRTDYPGTESETVPLDSQPGTSTELTCPNGDTYYAWKGAVTSAQYYVNPAGVSADKACQWGTAGSNMGNWAPVNLGVGQTKGATWISIMANKPTRSDANGLGFKIEIVGDNLGGSCKYENGQFTSLTGTNSDGCTVQVMSGGAKYVFSN